MYEYAADLISVVDGDTMHMRVDLGMHVRVDTTVRVLGINAPELSTAEGKAAKRWAESWFTEHGARVTINTVKDKREKYGRFLATIRAPGWHMFNEDILAAGHAVRYEP